MNFRDHSYMVNTPTVATLSNAELFVIAKYQLMYILLTYQNAGIP